MTKSDGGISLDSGVQIRQKVQKLHDASRDRCGVGWGRRVPDSMSLGHALDWEELAAGERPG